MTFSITFSFYNLPILILSVFLNIRVFQIQISFPCIYFFTFCFNSLVLPFSHIASSSPICSFLTIYRTQRSHLLPSFNSTKLSFSLSTFLICCRLCFIFLCFSSGALVLVLPDAATSTTTATATATTTTTTSAAAKINLICWLKKQFCAPSNKTLKKSDSCVSIIEKFRSCCCCCRI